MYTAYDTASYLLEPSRRLAQIFRSSLRKNPFAMNLGAGRFAEGLADMFLRTSRYVKKPEFNIDLVKVEDKEYPVYQTTVLKKDFCNLLKFKKVGITEKEPKVLIISPVSGHFATLQRDTVKRMLQKCEVYITDWKSMRDVPLKAGCFDLDTYLSYLIDFMHHIGPNTHVMAVCQPAVQIMALAAIMDEDNDPCMPATIVPMGGPIDPRVKKTQVNELAETYPLSWFERNFLTIVPEGHIGAGRRVYPGFIQITAFINMNPDAHYRAHIQYLEDKILNNVAGMQKHADFYDEYLSVLDMDDIYYLQTVEKVFQTYDLPRGIMKYKGHTIDLKNIKHCPLMTVEGEKDDISAPGQSYAAHGLCSSLPAEMHDHYLQPGVGHYGVFSGSKWRAFVAPKIEEFIFKFDKELGSFYKKSKK